MGGTGRGRPILKAGLGLVALAVVWLRICGAAAATSPGTIDGVVSDAAGRPLAGVRLRLETPGGRGIAETRSTADGLYRLTGVAPGEYRLIADMAGFAPVRRDIVLTEGAGASAEIAFALANAPLATVEVTAQRLDAARAEIAPRIGASTYSIPAAAIGRQPAAENNPLSQVLLQAPGVSQEAFGQLHVRNEMANTQFRLNGIILPEGVSFFGQSLSPRYASAAELVTGALPAQYGLRTAGIIDIETKSGAFDTGGEAGLYGGSHGLVEPSASYGGSLAGIKYFVTADYLRSGIGIENPTPSYNPIHDDTRQGHGFAYLEKVLDDTSKVAAILGTYQGHFQIPNIPGQTPSFAVPGGGSVDSARLDENQREINHYGVLSLLRSTADADGQLAAFARYSSLRFTPDPSGDLAFNGIAENAYRRSIASGVQGDASYRIAADHTLRGGIVVTGERSVSATTSLVLPVTGCGAGGATAGGLCAVVDNGARTGWTYSVYLQDEWRLTPTLTLNYGGRFDVVNTISNENQLSPRINAVWKPTSTTTVHAGYARYFSPPPFEHLSVTSIEKFTGTTAEPEVKANAAAKAERDHYVDIGVSQLLAKGLTAGIDAYYKYARNLIDIGQFGAPIIFTPFNYHMGRNLGVELTTSYARGDFTFYGNLAIAYQKAKGIASAQFNFDAEELAFLNTHTFQTDHSQIMTASGGVSYLWRGTRVSLSLLAGSGFRNSVTGPNQNSLPSWEQVNLGLSRRFELPAAGALEARLDIINLFDEIYRIRDGTGVSVGAPQFGPRRTVFAGLRKDF